MVDFNRFPLLMILLLFSPDDIFWLMTFKFAFSIAVLVFNLKILLLN